MNPSYQHFATHDKSEYPELWEGCIGAWAPCLGPTGTRLYDNSGKANWGTLTNMDAATDWVVSRGQYAMDFDAIEGSGRQAVEIPNSATMAGADKAAISIWVERQAMAASTLNGAFFYEQTTSNGFTRFGVFHAQSTGAVQFVCRDTDAGSSFAISTTPSLAFNHIVGNYDSVTDRMELFVNGASVGTNTASKGPIFGGAAGTPPIAIGAFTNGIGSSQRSSNSIIFEVSAYRGRVFSQSQVSLLYQIGPGGMYAPRRRRKAYYLGPTFNAAWARGANQFIQPSMIGVA